MQGCRALFSKALRGRKAVRKVWKVVRTVIPLALALAFALGMFASPVHAQTLPIQIIPDRTVYCQTANGLVIVFKTGNVLAINARFDAGPVRSTLDYSMEYDEKRPFVVNGVDFNYRSDGSIWITSGNCSFTNPLFENMNVYRGRMW